MTAPAILVTRPEAEAHAFADALRARGYTPLHFPLLRLVEYPNAQADIAHQLAAPPPPQAIIVTSRHALTSLGQPTLPLFTVGASTAALAAEMGFSVTHAPTLPELMPLILQRCRPGFGSLVYARGRNVSHDLVSLLHAEGYSLREVKVYAMDAVFAMPRAAQRALKSRTLPIATFFSRRTAEAFLTLAEKARLVDALAHVHAIGFSPDIAQTLARVKWKSISACAEPTLESMLAEVDKQAQKS